MELQEIKSFLDEKVLQYNAPSFIDSDPISIPKKFTKKEDIEIAGYIAATISWGQRKAILKAAENILQLMDYEPFDFVMNGDFDSIPDGALYRTFNGLDFRYILSALRNIYKKHNGLEAVFTQGYQQNNNIKDSLIHFRDVFTSFQEPGRTAKHIANTAKGSSSKRVLMYLRWMVRQDKMGVDFGLWNQINQANLLLPLDVHTGNVGRKLGILTRNANDFKSVEEITSVLKSFDPNDPIKYDYALFGLGVFEKF
ncbi:TIGR02757 family protein [Saccharicrinis aurantiacus]|uniref:TIGR02757 family protein n=1 Tax=Saccharicrinis aurantiacus TaxID=1849719 RepID=UPI002492D821|nr:TIGR02757 family protein [Saccharicrinis aurantiacus]